MSIVILKVVLAILISLTAMGLTYAVVAPLPSRGAGRVDRRRQPRSIDPHPNDMPGFTREQLEEIARRPVEQHHAAAAHNSRGLHAEMAE